MQGDVSLVVDTNLFHECLSLDAQDFPWADLGEFDAIELLVPDTVQSELDRQKKDTRPRVRRRAVQAVAWFRDMLRGAARQHVFRDQGPRVVMRVTAQAPSAAHPDLLDFAVDDDRIVGVAVALKQADPARDLRVLSHDTRPLAKADALGLPFEFIPDSWIREPVADDNEREIARLRAVVAELQSSHPALELAALGAVDKVLSLAREAYGDLSEQEAAEMRARLSERFAAPAIEAEAAREANTPRPDPFRRKDMTRVLPTPQAIKRYRDHTHPAWIDSCFAHVAGVPTVANALIAPPTVTVTLDNNGYRPAENVRVRFTARGPFLVAPARDGGYAATYADLPQLPWPPTDTWLQDGMPVGFATPVDNTLAIRPFNLDELRHATPARDDEGWYYEEDAPEAPTEFFELECRRFRHGVGPMSFPLLIFPQQSEAVVRGALEVNVSAGNVGKALLATFPVNVATTFESPVAAIDAFLAEQGPIKALLRARRA